MDFVYPFIHVLLYIAMHFAPADIGRIAIDGPEGRFLMLNRDEGGWTFKGDDGEGFASLRDGTVTIMADGETQALSVMEYVAAAVGNDWSLRPKVSLGAGTSLEKTGEGFDFVREGQRFRIRFLQPEEAVVPGVNVLGAVGRPGRYPLADGATVASVLRLAEGVTGDAEASKARILRGKPEEKVSVLPFDPDDEESPRLQDGDTIYVPARPAE